MQEDDANRRMKILRGEVPAPLQIANEPHDDKESESRPSISGRERKKRKRAGENDTEFEMRVAKEARVSSNSESQLVLRRSTTDGSLTDATGHIDLFPDDRPKPIDEKKLAADKDVAKRKQEYEKDYTVKFSDAAGFKVGLESPWYSSRTRRTDEEELVMPSKDIWGNEDPRRKEREAARIVSNDPLAMMHQGAAKVRQVEKERKQWKAERDKEMLESMRANEKRRRHGDLDDGLESFSLNTPERRVASEKNQEERRRRHSSPRQRLHRDRSRSRSPQRSQHRDRSRDRERGRDRSRERRRHSDRHGHRRRD
jgi:hypothetical protein